MKVDVLNIQGEKTGRSVDLPESVFGIEPNEHVVYLAVKLYMNNQRQGTHKTKERGEIAYSTRKVKRQKGTGTARMGSIRNPILRGGGRTFGPRPRGYGFHLNKKTRQLARNSALSSKMKEEGIRVIEDFTFDKPKTREFSNILKNLDLDNKKTLLLVNEHDRILHLSSRNIQHANVMDVREVHPYAILHADTLVFSESSVEKLKESLA